MKRRIVFIWVLLFASFTQHGSAQVFSKGTVCFSAGYGLVTMINVDHSLVEDKYTNVKSIDYGPVYAKAEVGLSKHIGLGVNFAYGVHTWQYNEKLRELLTPQQSGVFQSRERRETYSILARLNIHSVLLATQRVDPYAGIGVGYRYVSFTKTSNAPEDYHPDYGTYYGGGLINPDVRVGFEFTMGVKYLITPYIAAYAEGFITKSLLQGGIVFNLPGK